MQSTPGFKAVDLDFREALAAMQSDGQDAPSAPAGLLMLVSDPGHFASGDSSQPTAARRAVKYQVGGSVTLDGNSVDLDYEKLTAAQNALDYEAAANFTTQTVNMLMTAIKGSAASGSLSSG